MGHVRDQWTTPVGGKRVRNERWGKGKRWLARWQESGRERTKAYATKDEALTRVAQAEAGVLPSHAHGGPTVAAWGEQWAAAQLHHRDGTRDSTGRSIRRITRTIGDKTITELTRSDVQDAVITWSQTLAPATVHVTYSALTSMLKTAVIDGLIPAMPTLGVKLPRIERDRVVPLTVEQVGKIIGRLPAWSQGMGWLAAASGMRGGELRGLTADRVDGRMVRVDRQLIKAGVWGPPKSKAGRRTLDIGDAGAARLEAHMKAWPPGQDDLLFTTRHGSPYTRGTMSDQWRRATTGMPLRPRSGWHDLRHFYASVLISDGLSPRLVADLMGHEDPAETLRTYSHLMPSDRVRAVAAIDAVISTIGSSDGAETERSQRFPLSEAV